MAKKPPPEEAGRRVTFWLSERDYWLLDVIDAKVNRRLEMGTKCSRSDVIREELTKNLKSEVT